jgi:hypothetical protein
MARTKAADPGAIRRGVLAHCESLRVPGEPYGRYVYSRLCKPTYWASAFVALVRNLFGDLDGLAPDQRRQWADYLAGGQDEPTGLYLDPVFRSEERISASHTDEVLFWHSTTFILSALDILGGKPRYPIRACHHILNPRTMVERIEGLPWKITPWVVGNWTYDIGSLVGFDHAVTGDPANLEAMEAFFQWHEAHQDPDTGWWDLVGGFPIRHLQYGGYHTLMVYWMFGRQVPRPEAMIDSSLSFQAAEGHFGGGCCSDMDVTDTVCTLSQQYGIRRRKVAEAMEKTLPWVLHMQVPGGGFLDYEPGKGEKGKPNFRDEFGWKQCRSEPNGADPCSDFFRGFSLAVIAEVLPGTGLEAVPWRHHGTFGHGVRPKEVLARLAGR